MSYTPQSDKDVEYADDALMQCDRVFVYGTLKKGHGNNTLLRFADYLSTTQTVKPFVLGDVGFPYAFRQEIVPDQHKKLLFPVEGEVWKVPDLYTFIGLDGLEGFPTHYNRRIIETDSGVTAWMYMQDDWTCAQMCDACDLNKGVWKWSGR